MDFIIEQAVTWWQFTTVAVLIVVGFVINLFGVDNDKELIGFTYKEMPHMKPVLIPTAGKGFWGAIKLWILGGRTWEIAKDWNYTLGGVKYVIPKGFVFDGASVPKFLASWLSPVGVLLVGGLVHDYGYKYETLYTKDKGDWKDNCGWKTQKDMDIIFRDINIEQNGFHFLNYLAYWALRIGGFAAWNGHRKRNCKIGE
jgi:hypothetical protein